MGVKYSFMRAAVALLRLMYAPMKLRKTKKRITIISRQSKDTTLDIALLNSYIEENFQDVQCRVMVKYIGPGISNKISYGVHLIAQMWAIASSKVIVLDGYCITASVLTHKQDLIIIQLWHALAAIKKFGYQTIDKKAGHSREVAKAMCMHRNYDYVIASSEETGKLFCQGFNTSKDKLQYYGLPRIDEILRNRKVNEEASCGPPDICDQREIILYAPTFRAGKQVDVASLMEAMDEKKYKLVVKLHPLHDERGISDNTYTTYEWLRICDRVITDYSALGVEASLTNKPLYFYVYDIDEYDNEVGLNVNPLVEMPNASTTDINRLMEMLEEEYDFDALEKFRNKYISINTDNCTKQLGDFIYGLTC